MNAFFQEIIFKYGVATYAALIKTCREIALDCSEAYEYVEEIYERLKIIGENSYNQLIDLSRKEGNIDLITDVFYSFEEEKAEDIYDFLFSFLHLQDPFKERLENKIVEIHSQRGEDDELFYYIYASAKPFNFFSEDMKKARHLEELEDFYEKDKLDNNFLITADCQATALLAVKYLSWHLVEEDSDEVDEDLYQEGFDSGNKIEILRSSDFFKDNFFPNFQGNQENELRIENGKKRFEVKIQENDFSDTAVLIIEEHEFPSDLHLNKIESLMEKYTRLIIIFIWTNENSNKIKKIPFWQPSDSSTFLDDLIFDYNYDLVQVYEPDIDSTYSQDVFRDFVHGDRFFLSKDFEIQAVLKKIYEARKHDWNGNDTILKAVQKAISFKKDKGKILQEDDFDYFSSVISKKEKKGSQKKLGKSSVLEELDRNIFGLHDVKETMLKALNMLTVNEKRKEEGLKKTEINNVFAYYGQPGTGKTEMANYFAKLMIERNILKGDKFLSINGADLKGSFVGHTAPKIKSIFDENDIIFIDEAYSIASSSGGGMDSFSQEALAQLCVELEEHSQEKLIIFAGYGGSGMEGKANKMKEFLEANPGISSRITFHIDFPTYKADYEMPIIFEKMVENADYLLEEGWEEAVIKYFSIIEKTPAYGNAREARKLMQHAANFQSERIYKGELFSREDLLMIKKEDLELAIENLLKNSNITSNFESGIRIGF